MALKKYLLSLAACLLTVLAYLSLAGSCFAQADGIPKLVMIEDNYFNPKTITIETGQKIIWVNKGKKDHTVTSSSGDFDSEHIAPGDTFGYVFTKPGVYKYSCSIHSFLFFGMKGKVIVK